MPLRFGVAVFVSSTTAPSRCIGQENIERPAYLHGEGQPTGFYGCGIRQATRLMRVMPIVASGIIQIPAVVSSSQGKFQLKRPPERRFGVAPPAVGADSGGIFRRHCATGGKKTLGRPLNRTAGVANRGRIELLAQVGGRVLTLGG